MPKKADDLTAEQIREDFAAEPGKGHLAEAALAERANLVAYGGDTSAVDKRLAALGLGPAATTGDRKAAAADRKAALEEITSGPGRSGADPAPPSPPEAPEPGAGPAGDGDAAASGEPGQGEPAEGDAGDGDGTGASDGDGDGDGDDGKASPARKRPTAGRKPGGPKSTT